jgi:hypothetical protein
MYPPYRAVWFAAGMVNIMMMPMHERTRLNMPARVRLVYLAMTRASKLPATAAAPGAMLRRVDCSGVKPNAEMIDGPVTQSVHYITRIFSVS